MHATVAREPSTEIPFRRTIRNQFELICSEDVLKRLAKFGMRKHFVVERSDDTGAIISVGFSRSSALRHLDFTLALSTLPGPHELYRFLDDITQRGSTAVKERGVKDPLMGALYYCCSVIYGHNQILFGDARRPPRKLNQLKTPHITN